MATAKDFTELVAWQRADDLERFVQGIIRRPLLARDFEFCRQASDAAASAPRNIAEGFGRFAPIQFANFLRIAIGSELETRNQILKAWHRGAITDEEHYVGVVLCKRAIGATVGLRRDVFRQELTPSGQDAFALEHSPTHPQQDRIEDEADCGAEQERSGTDDEQSHQLSDEDDRNRQNQQRRELLCGAWVVRP